MRYRERKKDTPDHSYMEYLYPYDRTQRKAPSSSLEIVKSLHETMSDLPTPGFKRLSAQGAIINSPMTRTSVAESQTLNSWENYLGPVVSSTGVVNKTSGFLDIGVMPCKSMSAGYLPTPSIDTDGIRGRAITDAWANMDVSKTTALVTLAEAQKTVTSLTGILQRLIKIAILFKKLRWKELRKEVSAKEIADRYMEIRYSLRPLVYDVLSTLDALNGLDEKDRYTARGFAKGDASHEDSGQSDNLFASCLINYKRTTTVHVSARAGVLFTADLRGIAKDMQVWGMDEIALSMWELVPLSFVFDWFFNIGNIIAAWSPQGGLTPLASWDVTTIVTTQTYQATAVVKPGAYPDQDSRGRHVTGSGSMTRVTTTKIRTPNPDRPILPSFRLNLDTLKLVDLMIILKNILK